MIDLCSQIDTEKLSPDEINIILGGITNCSSMKPEEPHVVSYGDSIKVVFKSKERKILRITVEDSFWRENESKIVNTFNLANNPASEKIYNRVVFSGFEELSIPPFMWRDEFQIGRVPDGNPKPYEKIALYPCLFQFKSPVVGNLRLDIHRSNEIFKRRFLPLIPILRHYCTTNLQFDPSGSIKKSWALTQSGNEYTSEWLQLDYDLKSDLSTEDFHHYKQPSVKQLPVSETDMYRLSSTNLSIAYHAYEILPYKEKEKFLLGCEWFNKSVTAHEPTDRFLFMTIMLEIFIPNDSTNCDECNQPVYGVNRRFKTYVSETIGKDWTQDFEKVLGNIYALRCGVSHNGIAVAQHSSGFIPVQWKEREQLDYLFNLGRQFLISWLGLMFEKEKKSKGVKM